MHRTQKSPLLYPRDCLVFRASPHRRIPLSRSGWFLDLHLRVEGEVQMTGWSIHIACRRMSLKSCAAVAGESSIACHHRWIRLDNAHRPRPRVIWMQLNHDPPLIVRTPRSATAVCWNRRKRPLQRLHFKLLFGCISVVSRISRCSRGSGPRGRCSGFWSPRPVHVAELIAEFKLGTRSAVENWLTKLSLILMPKKTKNVF